MKFEESKGHFCNFAGKNRYNIKKMNEKKLTVRQNSFRAWILAARPKTLSGAAVPVMIGTALAYSDAKGDVRWTAVLLCFLFAFIMQIDANFVNDYFDFKHGNDSVDRLGPPRACTEGWITPHCMLRGIILTTLLACLTGVPLIVYGGITAIVVGILCVLFCFLYTTHLSYLGLGDVLVLLFFGIVPVVMTRYVSLPEGIQEFSRASFIYGLACGLIVDTLLVVNNYRDINNDQKAGKRTLVVFLGRKLSLFLYAILGVGAGMMIVAHEWGSIKMCSLILSMLVYLLLHLSAFKKLCGMKTAKDADSVLAATARNIFVFGLMTSLMLTWGASFC